MILSDFGQIIHKEWLKSFEIRQELFLDEYIIMPNHLHAIIIIDKKDTPPPVETHGRASNIKNSLLTQGETHGLPPSETHGRASLQGALPIFYRSAQLISSFMAGFKSAVNSRIDDYIDENQLKIAKYNRHNHFFQANYHDHIIRNAESYQNIKDYIINNPTKWPEDKFYSP